MDRDKKHPYTQFASDVHIDGMSNREKIVLYGVNMGDRNGLPIVMTLDEAEALAKAILDVVAHQREGS